MLADTLDRQIAEMLGIIRFLEMPEADRQALLQRELAARRQRTAQRNARFANSLCNATDIQTARISSRESDGYKVVKLWERRGTGRIAVMLQKSNVWNQDRGVMGTKLVIVYPDGRNQEAFGKIAIQNDWF